MDRRTATGMMVHAGRALVALALGIGASVWLTNPSNLPVNHVSVHATYEHLDPVWLETAIGEALQGNMFTQDLVGLEQHLQQNVWVRWARIQRDWPDGLRIEVTEQVPVVRWEAGGFLNEQGERFTPQDMPELALVRLSGMPGREKALAGYLDRLRKMLASRGLHLAVLEETRFRSLHLTMRSGLRLALGRVRPFERLARWLRYYDAYAQVAPTGSAVIDLRYPNGFAVRPSTES